jgi:hypothetical protein
MCEHQGQAQREMRGMQMRTFIALAVVVAIGLIWSVAAMSKLVPVPIADMETAATSPDASSGTTGQGKRASSE